VIGGGIVAYLLWGEAQQLKAKATALAEIKQLSMEKEVDLKESQRQLDEARANLSRWQVDLNHAQANILSEVSKAKLLQGALKSALRLASFGTRIDLSLPPDARI